MDPTRQDRFGHHRELFAARAPEGIRRIVLVLLALLLIMYAPLGMMLAADPSDPTVRVQLLIGIFLTYLPIVTAVSALAQLATQRPFACRCCWSWPRPP